MTVAEALVFVLRVYRYRAAPQSEVAGIVEVIESEKQYPFTHLEEIPEILRRVLRSKGRRTKPP